MIYPSAPPPTAPLLLRSTGNGASSKDGMPDLVDIDSDDEDDEDTELPMKIGATAALVMAAIDPMIPSSNASLAKAAIGVAVFGGLVSSFQMNPNPNTKVARPLFVTEEEWEDQLWREKNSKGTSCAGALFRPNLSPPQPEQDLILYGNIDDPERHMEGGRQSSGPLDEKNEGSSMAKTIGGTTRSTPVADQDCDLEPVFESYLKGLASTSGKSYRLRLLAYKVSNECIIFH